MFSQFSFKNINKLLAVLSFLAIQLLPIQEAQAQTTYPGYTPWSQYVSNLEGCGANNVECSGFTEGSPIYMIVYNTCTWSGTSCASTTSHTVYGNDPYALLAQRMAAINAIYSVTDGYTFSYQATTLNSSGLNYDTFRPSGGGTVYTGSGTVAAINSPTCSGYKFGIGCPNTSGDNQLDRTKKKDGPCEICSKIGNPFDVRDGSKTESAIDIDFPITVQRIYSSKPKFTGMFGLSWRSNFDKKLMLTTLNSMIVSAVLITPDNDMIIFNSTDGINFSSAYVDDSQYLVVNNGTTIQVTRPDSGKEFYDKNTGKILSESYKGKTLTYQYNSNGMLYRVVDATGKYLQFFFSGYADVVDQITASNGDVLSYTYDGGNVSNVSLNGVSQITYLYSYISTNNGSLISGKLDGNGVQYAIYSYDAQGRGIENKWITSTGHEVKKYSFSYPNTNQTVVTQGNGFSRTYNMTIMNYQYKISNLNWNGFTEQTSFDNNGNVTQKKDFNGVYENYTYDNAGRILTYSRDGKQVSLSWDTTNNIVSSMTETSANGTRTTSFNYDGNNNLLSKTVTGAGDTLTWNYTWTADGRILSESAPDGLVTTYTYTYNDIDSSNISGLLYSISTNAGQSIIINAYDSRGNPTSMTVNGVSKTMTYDYKGRILSESTAGITNIYTYDINGNMLTATMASGYALNMAYDTANRLLSIQDNMGGSVSFGIDDYTNEVLNTSISQGSALVRARNKIIDSLGRTTQAWNATTRTKQLTNYSSYIDKPNSTTDANGNQAIYGWNSRDDMTNYSGNGDNSSNSYDIDSNLKSITVNNQQTTMNYDDFGRVTSLSSPDSGNHTYAYNTANRTVSHTDAKGIVHTSVADLNGNPVSISHSGSGSSQSESYSYDISGSLVGFTDGSGSTIYTRNGLEQVTSKTQNIAGKSFTVSYGYNAIGQKVTETYPSGLVVTYGYNNGFVSSVSAGGSTIVSGVNYNSMLKEATSWNLGGNSVSVNKDADGILNSFVESNTFNQSITTDNEGHVVALNDNTSSNNFAVNLTANYAIQSGTINSKTLSYNVTTNNNMYSQQDGLTNISYTISYGNNKLAGMNDNITNIYTTYQYDANGNTTVDNRGSYTYDLKNNMTSSTRTLSGTSYTGTYSYNALGHRVMKNVSGQIRYFVYNENSQLIGEYDSSGNAIAEYVYFGLRPVAVKTGGNINIVHTDYLGTPRIVTNGGSVVWQWKNDNPYGYNQALGSIEFNLRFAGQYYDYESGLHYNIHRTYNPEIGRYMQSDPIGLAGGSNTYNYVGRNPLDGVDPLGLEEVNIILVQDSGMFSLNHAAIKVGDKYYDVKAGGGNAIMSMPGMHSAFNQVMNGIYSPMPSLRSLDNNKFFNDENFSGEDGLTKYISYKIITLDLNVEEIKNLNKSIAETNSHYGIISGACSSYIGRVLQNAKLKNWGWDYTPTLLSHDIGGDSLIKSKITSIKVFPSQTNEGVAKNIKNGEIIYEKN